MEVTSGCVRVTGEEGENYISGRGEFKLEMWAINVLEAKQTRQKVGGNQEYTSCIGAVKVLAGGAR